jgi:hypothetical protein
MTNSNNELTKCYGKRTSGGQQMNSDVMVFLPNVILLILFIVFIWSRHSIKNFDWLMLITSCLGVALFAIVVQRVLGGSATQSTVAQAVLIAIPTVILVLFLLFLTRVLTVEQMKSKLHFDERIALINAKSARNALVAIFLCSVVDLIIYPDMTKNLLLGILGISLIAYLTSMIIYYYRSF